MIIDVMLWLQSPRYTFDVGTLANYLLTSGFNLWITEMKELP